MIINYSGYFRVIGEITKTGRRVVTIRLMSDICVKRKKADHDEKKSIIRKTQLFEMTFFSSTNIILRDLVSNKPNKEFGLLLFKLTV